MLLSPNNAPVALDITTLFIVATCITALLGLLLLSAWAQERIRALAWWGTAYLIGGFSVAIWSFENLISPPLPPGVANTLLFVACGMIWSAARIFHGRRVLLAAMSAGAIAWLIACMVPEFAYWTTGRIVLNSLIVSAYTFLTAAELWRERRKSLLRRWPAIFVPIMHGAVFLLPIPLASLLPAERGIVTLASGWIAVFALETMLYVVGTAFIVLVMAKERTVRIQRDAASTDELTGILNRRGFYVAAHQLVARQTKKGEPVSVLMFDLDHFKSINDRYGHATGDEALRVFATSVSGTMRASDVVARFGGEEFIAILPGSLADARAAAERVRLAFQGARRHRRRTPGSGDGQHRGRERRGVRGHCHADRRSRQRALSRQVERPQSGRGRRAVDADPGRRAAARSGRAGRGRGLARGCANRSGGVIDPATCRQAKRAPCGALLVSSRLAMFGRTLR
jgi:diguanylate cyclase (GGDEF)-like protein